MSDHFAKPVLRHEPERKGITLVAVPICVICGKPIKRSAKRAAPGAWRHVPEPDKH